MGRLIIVSNRVAPISEGGPAAGGLAVGVYDALRETGGMWFGWSGEVIEEDDPARLHVGVEQHGPVTFATIGLTRRDYDQYYRGFSNATLWPTLHYRTDLTEYDRAEYEGYKRVNGWLARQLLPLLRDDDVIWVHDYHLMPFAETLRAAGVRNRIGFFLHTPFPAAQVFATVPPHADLARGLCAYDLVGLQTDPDLRAFIDYIEHEADGTVDADGTVRAHGRTLAAHAYPIGIYPDELAALAEAGSQSEVLGNLRKTLLDTNLIVSVDRLDYSKGLTARFRAFESLLATHPEERQRVSFMQIAPPTRSDVHAYQNIRDQLESEAGRINGRYGEMHWTPIRYIHRQYDRPVLASVFRLAHVGFVTPLRDGMNLVAKEYVAAQDPENPGVLVLSRFAGAARQMTGALIVNPLDIEGMADALAQALHMPLDERRDRYQDMMDMMRRESVSIWRDTFLRDLGRV
ncbi:trehalose-6-phosphate synthase [Robbsia andropogonis]|uniref:Trehalose-6-phosphate synthase n=1 Tax=Robbsia andropogonis TaxID=28092 RepID=A0A0F5K1U7_9BURK|nr:alpha,alpha-trehalose-phosphate synthase (UDP-forming) [Robbsia andropogonis]KKB64053.1 trehalose-6-phosphate synthase [Robbsia andropogonis]MCP1119769.1 alpha,alpha-trehalose-phosphate synthase (UDP-forming) [Robbsia andropogonis]MCP1128802.1 alpha,alpha-trehalose-phosphate synthase (UDP-forming) [Robbsia andropogonis]